MTIKQSIINYLEEQGGWQYAGKIARVVADIHSCKESNCERRMRELVKAGIIDRELIKLEGVANKVVRYSVARAEGQSPPSSLNIGKVPPEPRSNFHKDFLLKKRVEESQNPLL